MPGPIAAFGTGVDTDALYRRINLLESRSQDPLNVNIGGGQTTGGSVSGQTKIKLDAIPIDRSRARRLMSTPPTPTFTTAHTIVSPRLWAATQNTSSGQTLGGSCFSYFGGGNPTVTGAAFPDYQFVGFPYVSYGAGTNFNTQARVAFMHFGRYLEIMVKGSGGVGLLKVDDSYVSLTPQTFTNDGSTYYWYFDFGSTAERRIDLVGYAMRFGGVYTEQTAQIRPAPRRGPKCIIGGDSFTEGTGSTPPMSYVWHFAEEMGWDDVWASGIGGSGYIAPANGTNPSLVQRLTADIIAYAPGVFIPAMGINDSNFTSWSAADLQTAASTVINNVRSALPLCRVAVAAPFWKGGPATLSTSILSARVSVKAAADAAGVPYLDPWELPLNTNVSSAVLSASATAGATSISASLPLCPGQTYKFPDGTRFECKAVTAGSGPYTISIDAPGLQTNQSSGATLTACGNTLYTGNGKVGATTGYGSADLYLSNDGTHPSPQGHAAIGQCLANLFIQTFSNV